VVSVLDHYGGWRLGIPGWVAIVLLVIGWRKRGGIVFARDLARSG